jgi:hypothetical protein
MVPFDCHQQIVGGARLGWTAWVALAMSIFGATGTTSATGGLTPLLIRCKVWDGLWDKIALCHGLRLSNLLPCKLLGGMRGGQHYRKLLDHVIMFLSVLRFVGSDLLHQGVEDCNIRIACCGGLLKDRRRKICHVCGD